jgi:TonB family protein
MIEADPADVSNHLALSKMYEDSGRYDDAERWLLEAKTREPRNREIYNSLAGFYNRQGDFTKTMDALLQAADVEPQSAEAHQRVAVFYWEKAFRDHRLTPAQKHEYLVAGIAGTDRALAVDPDHVDALTYKNIMLRMRANEESDRFVQQTLIAEADALRNRAIELGKQRAARSGGRRSVPHVSGASPPPPAPPPPPPPALDASGTELMPVRVGGNIPTPTKIKDVKPVYPEEAFKANMQGVVILEATLDIHGQVSDARVLRSIPLLDQAAVDAVRQWAFTPTYLNGMAVPVIMTVTVHFTPPPP